MLLRQYGRIAEGLVAKAIAAHEKYRSKHQDDRELLWACFVEMSGIDEASVKPDLKERIKQSHFGCIHGLVYSVGLNGLLKDAMNMRCAQFVGYVDYYFMRRGISPCSDEMKKDLMVALDLGAVYESHPELFAPASPP